MSNSKKPSDDYIRGHNRGYKEREREVNQSELANWVDAATGLLFGSHESSKSKDYEKGRRDGYRDGGR